MPATEHLHHLMETLCEKHSLEINEWDCSCHEKMESAQFSGHSITSNPGLLYSGLHQPAKLGINPYTVAMVNNNSFCYVRVIWEQTFTIDGFVVGFFFLLPAQQPHFAHN